MNFSKYSIMQRKTRLSGKILGTGSYLPEYRLTDEEIADKVGIKREKLDFIETCIGKVFDRRRAGDNEKSSDMIAEASFKILENAKENYDFFPRGLEAIIVSPTVGDSYIPSTASFVQKKISERYGIDLDCHCFDVNNSCCGWLSGIDIGLHYLLGEYDNILVLGGTRVGTIVSEKEFLRFIFGDGAGGVLLGRNENIGQVVNLYNFGRYGDVIYLPSCQSIGGNEAVFHMADKKTLENILRNNIWRLKELLNDYGINAGEIDHLILHEGTGNKNLTNIILEEIKFPLERVISNYNKYGNTVSADLPIALDEAVKKGKIKKGDSILFFSYGAGISAGAWLVDEY